MSGSTLTELKRAIRLLTPDRRSKLEGWLREFVRQDPGLESERARKSQRKAVEEHNVGHKTYRREGVRCGKKGCKCTDGDLHGPYWYAYWSEGGKTRSKYIGRRLPRDIEAAPRLKKAGGRGELS
jgi:hypothetical protein